MPMPTRARAAALLATLVVSLVTPAGAATQSPDPSPGAASPQPGATVRPSKLLESLDPLPRLDPSVEPPALGREVVAYLPYWLIDGSFTGAPAYDPATDPWLRDGRLTDIVLFSIGIKRNGALDLKGPNAAFILGDAATRIIRAAHERGIRVLVSFVSGGYENNKALFDDRAATDRFIEEAARLVAVRGLDGADMDVELIRKYQFREWATTAARLRARLRLADPRARVTVAVNGNVSGATMAAMALSMGVDRAFLMGYAYRGPGTSPVGSISPLRLEGGLGLLDSLALYREAGVDLGRVLLGLPTYGLSWPVTGPEAHAERNRGRRLGDGRVTTFADAAGPDPGFATTTAVDEADPSAWTRWWDAGTGSWWQTWWDTPETFRRKAATVLTEGLAGLGVWTLGYTGLIEGYPDAVASLFARPAVLEASVAPGTTATLDVTVRATVAGALAPVTWVRLSNDGIAWGPWTDPAAAAAGIPWRLGDGPDGERTVWVRAADTEGRMSVPTQVTARLDTTPPDIGDLALTAVPGGLRASWTVHDPSGIAAVRIRSRVGDGAWTPWRAVRTPADPFVALPEDGALLPVELELEAADPLGNTGSVGISRTPDAPGASPAG